MERIMHSLSELETETARFVSALVPQASGATLVALSGELGAGKTAFTKAVAKTLGVEEIVNSPTFVLEKIYQLGGETPKFKRLVHIDAYRLGKGSELAALGFDEIMQEKGNLIMLEWPEKVDDALPVPAVRVNIVARDDGARSISYAP